MRVLLIHQHGKPSASGGAIATHRLHRALLRAGVESTVVCQRDVPADDPTIQSMPSPGVLDAWLGKATWRLGLNDVHCLSTFKLLEHPAFLEADVVNIQGWHSQFFSYLALPRLSAARPVVATLHDMWNFTGHCGFSLDCDRWKTGCGKCPDLQAFPPVSRDATALEWRLKNWVYSRSSMHVVAPSRALCDMARQSMLSRFDVRQIHNAIDTNLFRPLLPAVCRRELGLPEDKRIVMFAAASFANRIKGGDLLAAALEGLSDDARRDTMLLLLGVGGDDFAKSLGMPYRSLGFVGDDRTKAIAYAAADLFVLPSRMENQSLVMLESMACGTPVVGFDVGGNGETIRTDDTGWLAPAEDVDALRDGIERLLADAKHRNHLGRRARDEITTHHTIDRHVQSYVELFESLSATPKTISLPVSDGRMDRAA